MIDLHCHWVPGIDDGARNVDEGLEILRALRSVGFEHVVATPHMRPGMFPNDRDAIVNAYEAMLPHVQAAQGMPSVSLASEHYFDDVVFQRLLEGKSLPYNNGKCLLVELHAEIFPARIADRFFDLRRRSIRPVLAHPERYAVSWKDITRLDPIVDGGTVLLLDVAALIGKYGRAPERAAHELLEEGYYYAACSDSHRPADAEAAAQGIARMRAIVGDEETDFLMRQGPQHILESKVET
ncbi:MAG: CpsB/CapC family capsule biosynthesis tyrosine phosphatase [Polyangiaceae bacterium]